MSDELLIADDHDQNRFLVAAIAETAGYRVRQTANGLEALAAFREEPPALVLLDVMMPVMDGLEACRQMRACPHGQDVPIIFLTAASDETTLGRALESGADDLLMKPIRRAELLLRIRSLLRIGRLSQGLREANLQLEAQRDLLAADCLRLAQERQRHWELSQDMLVVTDFEGRARAINPAVTRTLGYTIDELLALPLPLLLHEQDLPMALAVLAERRDRTGLELRFRCRDGSPRLSSVNLAFAPDLGCIFVAVRDVTEERSLQRQLAHAQKLEAVGRVVSGVAHDFNNLMTVVIGTADLEAEELEPGDPRRQSFEMIRSTGQRAAELSSQLLLFSRKTAARPVCLQLDRVIEDTSKMLGRLLGPQVEVTTSLSAGAGCVLADPGQVGQVLMNLAINARDAMGGQGRLCLETRAVEIDEERAALVGAVHPGPYLLLSVADTGSGMDAKTLSRVFEPFFTTKGPGAGTGLGLSLVAGIVQGASGFLDVHTEPGRGTTFQVFLPSQDRPAEPVALRNLGPSAGGGELLLVVDDNRQCLDTVTAGLERQGYRVHPASRAVEALEFLANDSGATRLLLTDILMAGMTGAELVRRARRTRPGLRAMYTSGYPAELLGAHVELEPDVPLLPKPFTSRELGAAVRRLLDG